MSSEKARSYARGYNRGYLAGQKNSWPEHKPPLPPDKILKRALKAAAKLRDGYDFLCATLSEDDEVVVGLANLIGDFDAAMVDLSQWVRDPNATEPEARK